jgi:hypothetical protein
MLWNLLGHWVVPCVSHVNVLFVQMAADRDSSSSSSGTSSQEEPKEEAKAESKEEKKN